MTHRILVVDDSTTIQKVVKIAFAKYDAEVVTCGSLVEAMSEMNRVRPSVVLADANLPGVQTPEDFLSLARGVPMILLVGSYEVIDEEGFKVKGLTRIVRKPFESRDIVGLVEQIVGQPLRDKTSTTGTTPTQAIPPHHEPLLPPPPLGDPALVRKTVKATPPIPPSLHDFPEEFDEAPSSTHSGEEPLLPPPIYDSIPLEPRRRGEKAFSEMTGPMDLDQEEFDSPDRSDPGIFIAPRGKESYEETPLGTGYGDFPLPFETAAPVKLNTAPNRNIPPPPPPSRMEQMMSHEPQEVSVDLGLDIDHLKKQVEDIVGKELGPLVREAVERYCAKNFTELAREIILREIRRLTDERARHLVDN